MVSSITTGFPTDSHGRPFRRRRLLPWAVLVTILVVVAVALWVGVLSSRSSSAKPVDCPTPPAPSAAPGGKTPTLGTPVDRNELTSTAPAALSAFQIRVLNASDERGEAQRVLTDLTDQGFVPAPDPAFGDDPIYHDDSMNCYGQIRYGESGKAAAAALWIAAPCNELIKDDRAGTGVDLVLGEDYKSGTQSQDSIALLQTLRTANPKDPKTGADSTLLAAVHDTKC